MSVVHIVAFTFKDETPAPKHTSLRVDFLGLKHKCLKEGKPYIEDIIGGSQMSIEAHTKGLKNIIVVTFNSVEDRDYYLKEDEVHLAFGSELSNAVSDIWVGDFVNEAPPVVW